MLDVFCHLAGMVKMNLDWKRENGPQDSPFNDSALQSFYMNMALDEAYDELERSDFHWKAALERKVTCRRSFGS